MANRKFLYGDTVVVERRSVPHKGHTGKVGGTLIKLVNDSKPKTYYRIACECGSDLTLEAFSMDMIEAPQLPITEMRIQYFLSSIGLPGGTMDSALSQLSQREKDILERRNGLTGENKQTLREIGKVVGVSAERVRTIEARAMEKISAPSGK